MGIYIGFRLERKSGNPKPMLYTKDRHVLICGANGTGKSMRLGVPNLMQNSGRSWLVNDPKGLLAKMTANARRAFGSVVFLDPFNVTGAGSSGFNPLATLAPDSPSFNADAGLIAEAIITVDGQDPHWAESARVLLAWLIMHEVETARGQGAMPTLANVRRVLGEQARGATLAGAPPSGVVAEALEACQSEIEAIRNKAGQYTDFTKEVSSILATARRKTEFLDDVEVAKDLQGGYSFKDFQYARGFKYVPQTVYLTLPARMLERHKSWLRLAISAALNACLDDTENKGIPAVFFLDEFAALGHFGVIERNLPLVRGYGVQFMPVVQGMAQLEEIYGKGWSKFVGNAGAVCHFSPGDDLTAKWISERIGTQVVLMPSYGSAKDSKTGVVEDTVSYAPHQLPARTPNELYGMKDGELWVFLAGLSQGINGMVPWWKDVPPLQAAAG